MKEILKAVSDYERALSLLDDYDHQCLKTPKGNTNCVEVTYEECRILIDSKKFDSTIFGVEKDGSFKSSLNAIYQTAFGNQIYETVEEKAANLLYFVTKNHSFVDGNKRIAASVFLLFLHKNKILYKDGIKILSDEALVALVILIAQSKPEEKETMVKLTLNFLVK